MDTFVENLTQPLLESLSEDEDKQFINQALDDGKTYFTYIISKQ